jgi:hypothetical protein
VSVVDGGFPAIVDAMTRLTGTVEPVVLYHDEERYG